MPLLNDLEPGRTRAKTFTEGYFQVAVEQVARAENRGAGCRRCLVPLNACEGARRKCLSLRQFYKPR